MALDCIEHDGYANNVGENTASPDKSRKGCISLKQWAQQATVELAVTPPEVPNEALAVIRRSRMLCLM